MKFDGENEVHRDKARAMFNKLMDSHKSFELKELRPTRTLSQNAYLHVVLGYFAASKGYTMEEVKRDFFKRIVNPDIFVPDAHRRDLISTSQVTTEQLSTAISRFRNWSANLPVDPLYIPEPHEDKLILYAQILIEENKDFL